MEVCGLAFRSPEPKERAERGGLSRTPAERVREAGNEEGVGVGVGVCREKLVSGAL